MIRVCGLQPSGFFKDVGYADGRKVPLVPKFYVNVTLPNNVEIIVLPVMSGTPSGSDVVIGMDIISQGDFAVTNMNGKTKFSFSIPSQRDIDFVVEGRKAMLLRNRSSPPKRTRERARSKRNKKG